MHRGEFSELTGNGEFHLIPGAFFVLWELLINGFLTSEGEAAVLLSCIVRIIFSRRQTDRLVGPDFQVNLSGTGEKLHEMALQLL